MAEHRRATAPGKDTRVVKAQALLGACVPPEESLPTATPAPTPTPGPTREVELLFEFSQVSNIDAR
jgi:hypothetical protein